MTLSQPAGAKLVPHLGISLDNISKRYGDHVVLDDVSLHVEPGTVTALIGPSGAGKSTFLRCINLLERPDSGTIRVAGHTIETGRTIGARDLAALRSTVGMVFQSFNLFPHMSALKNISYPQQKVLGRHDRTVHGDLHRPLLFDFQDQVNTALKVKAERDALIGENRPQPFGQFLVQRLIGRKKKYNRAHHHGG